MSTEAILMKLMRVLESNIDTMSFVDLKTYDDFFGGKESTVRFPFHNKYVAGIPNPERLKILTSNLSEETKDKLLDDIKMELERRDFVYGDIYVTSIPSENLIKYRVTLVTKDLDFLDFTGPNSLNLSGAFIAKESCIVNKCTSCVKIEESLFCRLTIPIHEAISYEIVDYLEKVR